MNVVVVVAVVAVVVVAVVVVVVVVGDGVPEVLSSTAGLCLQCLLQGPKRTGPTSFQEEMLFAPWQ